MDRKKTTIQKYFVMSFFSLFEVHILLHLKELVVVPETEIYYFMDKIKK